MAKKPFVPDKKQGVPAYMVSFGDMMTLILTFFILLVSMSKEQSIGLMAQGLGSFVVAIKSMGMPGVLSGHEEQEIFGHMRRRFNLPPEPEDERDDEDTDMSTLELIKSKALERLNPHDEMRQPQISVFEADSDYLSSGSRALLDGLAETLRPGRSQILVLEGHALDAGVRFGNDNHRLAFARAQAVRDYLANQHGFPTWRMEPRAWIREIRGPGQATRSVDARLVTPHKKLESSD